MGSFVNGHKRSAGWICGEYGGRNINSTPSGTSSSLATMPARAVEHQDDVLVGAGADLGGERRQERAEQGCVDAVGDEPHDLARDWSDEAVQIKPLVAVMAAGGRTAAAW